jgi:60s Acidic ribosomal protein
MLYVPSYSLEITRSDTCGQLIAEGSSKLASVPSGGGGGGVSAASVGAAPGAPAAAAEEKKEEKVEEKVGIDSRFVMISSSLLLITGRVR